MPYTDVTVNNLVVNVLTQEEYDSIQNPSSSELYLITDNQITPAQAVENVATVSAVGTSTQYARADHVHAITGTAITSALGYTPGQGTLTDSQVNGTSIVSDGVANLVTNTVYNSSSNKIATMSDIPSQVDVQVNGTSIVSSGTANLVTNTAYDSGTNKLATMNDVDDSISEIEPLVVTATEDSDTGVVSFDKTFEEIDAAIQAGINVIVKDSSTSMYPYQGRSSTWSDRSPAHNFYRIEYNQYSDLWTISGYYIASGTASWAKGRISDSLSMDNYLQGTDIADWAKAADKPTYTASEVGALPDTYTAPVTSVNGQTGVVSLTIPSAVTNSYRSDSNSGKVMLYTSTNSSSTVTQTKTSGALDFSIISGGDATLQIGKSSTDEGTRGLIKISNHANANYTTIDAPAWAATEIHLPSSSGTLALTSEIPSVSVTDVQINGTSIVSNDVANIVTNTAYNASSNKIATMSDVPEDKLFLVTATMSGLTTGTSDKSVTEIAAAVAAGKFVYIKTTVGTTTIVAPLMHVVDTVDVSKAVFNYDDQQNSSQLYHAVLEITGTTVTITWTNEKYARESQIPDSTSDLTNDSGFITAATAPVTSVNNQTGDVVLTIPTATSDLTNDSGFITTIPTVTATGVLSFTNLNDVIEITHDTPAASDPEKLVSAVYPITIDSYGHITTAGSAVTIPSEVTESTVSGWGFTKNAGTVTSVTASGALTSSGGATPAITHNAPATSPAKGTQAVYPITIDSYGHILSAGSAVTIPSNVSSFTNDAGYLTLATLPIYNGEVS